MAIVMLGEAIVSIVLYTPLLLFGIYRILVLFLANKPIIGPGKQYSRKFFHIFIVLFLILRIGYVISVLFLQQRGELPLFFNGIGILMFFTSFTIVVFTWIEIFHNCFQVRTVTLKKVLPYFWAVNIIVWLHAIAIWIVILAFGYRDPRAKEASSVDVIIVACLFLFLSLSIGIYGMALHRKMLKQQAKLTVTGSAKRRGLKLIAVTLLLSICFLMRCLMFSWTRMGGARLPNWLYYSLSYLVAEVPITAYQLWVFSGLGKTKTEVKTTELSRAPTMRQMEVQSTSL